MSVDVFGLGRLETALPVEAEGIQSRLPIWRALADLYLDTWFDPAHYDRIAGELMLSGQSRNDLESIFLTEVTPAFAPNLFLDIAGEWAGWHDEIICETIGECLVKGANRLLPKRQVRDYARGEWNKVVAALDRLECS